MATRASLGQISMTPLNCPPSKTHCLVQILDIFFISQVMPILCYIRKFSCLVSPTPDEISQHGVKCFVKWEWEFII